MKWHVALVCVVALALAGAVEAADITVYPGDVADGAPTLGVTSDFPTGWDSGSVQANGVSYSKYFWTPEMLFGRDVTIGELQSISYWTKKDSTHTANAADWYFQMYTDPYSGSPGESWYGNRINSEPYFSADLNDPANTWNQWVTGAGMDNRLRFFDSSSGYNGGYGDPFLQDLTANSTYSGQSIMYLVLGTGTGWAAGFTGLLDGLSITLTDGKVANVNFEDTAIIPEPASMTLLGMALCGLAVARRRKR